MNSFAPPLVVHQDKQSFTQAPFHPMKTKSGDTFDVAVNSMAGFTEDEMISYLLNLPITHKVHLRDWSALTTVRAATLKWRLPTNLPSHPVGVSCSQSVLTTGQPSTDLTKPGILHGSHWGFRTRMVYLYYRTCLRYQSLELLMNPTPPSPPPLLPPARKFEAFWRQLWRNLAHKNAWWISVLYLQFAFTDPSS